MLSRRQPVECRGGCPISFGRKYKDFSTELLRQIYSVMGAEAQVQRLGKVASWLEEKSPLRCCEGLGVRILRTPQECPRGTDAGFSHLFAPPACVLRPGGSITVPWPIDKQIDQHGPYDAELFQKRVRIAVICPEEFVGEVGQFLQAVQRRSCCHRRQRTF